MIMSFFAWLLAVPPLVALTIYCVEIVVGLKRPPVHPLPDAARQGPVVLLVPAHNEAAGIASTVAGLRSIAPPGARILVIADNCADDTAAIARAAGAEVAERFDANLRGKGYALSYGCSVLAKNPPATVIVVDADAVLAPGSVEHLCRVTESGSPAQASNLLIPDRTAPALVQISSFAFLIKNLVRSRGLGRIGRCALLTGSGMAFPWAVFETAPLASGDITEDIGLGIALTRRCLSAHMVEQAVVLSGAANLDASVAQRRRWEHGFLASALRNAVPMLGEGLRQGSRSLIALGLHFLVPPIALLMIVAFAMLVVLAAIGAVSGVWAPAIGLAGATGVALFLTGIAWLLYGRETLQLGALAQAPLYVLWKLPLYLRFLVNRETRWQRTQREGEGEGDGA